MDEKKEKTSKRIAIKNKKEATKTLSKTPSKTSTKSKKTSTKKTKSENVNIKAKIEKKPVETKAGESKKTAKKVATKTVDKTPKVKKETKKVTKKKEEKTKLVLPKEWKVINQKVANEKKDLSGTSSFTGILKNSFFEEIDEKLYYEKKKKEKENLKKALIIGLIILISVLVVVYLLFKYNEDMKKQLAVYDEYVIGDKVKLKDESIWYVVSDAGSSEETVKLLSEKIIDVNNDSVLNDKDKKKYNSTGTIEYDKSREESIAFYLENEYKKELQKSIGKIEEIDLLNSKEFVKIRERMGFGYEWTQGNWLANSKLGTWWIISEQNEKVYAVVANGTYRLFKPDASNYVRPTIVVKKELVTKVELPKEDNINDEKKD